MYNESERESSREKDLMIRGEMERQREWHPGITGKSDELGVREKLLDVSVEMVGRCREKRIKRERQRQTD